MDSQKLKQRHYSMPVPIPDLGPGIKEETTAEVDHPGGDVKHGGPKQLLRLCLLASYFWSCCFTIGATQAFGVPLYWINRDWYYAYMALTKQSFGLLVTTMTQWWSPTVLRINGDDSVSGQMRKAADGRVECNFPERLVLMANHQLYTDWLYLWWMAYTNQPQMHGHIYIILKESLKYVPILGPGIMFFGFVFMSRKIETDKPRLSHRLQQLKTKHSGPMSGSKGYDPMWFLIFPEGTNLSDNGRAKSAKWAEKTGIPDFQHQLIPRSTGLFYILNELGDTVDWIYDCTMAYEGVPRGKYGQDFFTLRSIYFEGRPPRSVNLYWRRIAVNTIPLNDAEEFDQWLKGQWRIKDDLMEEYLLNGRFPPSKNIEIVTRNANGMLSKSNKGEYIETEVRQAHWWEFTKIFMVLAAFGLVANITAKMWNVIVYGTAKGYQY